LQVAFFVLDGGKQQMTDTTTVPPQGKRPDFDQMDSLRDIGHLINTQDNRYTDQPMFIVFEKRGMVTLDTHDHDRIEWYDPDNVSTADDHKAKRLEALHNGGRDTPGWERYAVKDIDVFVTACFTEQGCKDFLARDGHNLSKPFIYACGSYRNSEFRAVRGWLKSLAGKASQDEPAQQAKLPDVGN
jgi:hypothetical protein